MCCCTMPQNACGLYGRSQLTTFAHLLLLHPLVARHAVSLGVTNTSPNNNANLRIQRTKICICCKTYNRTSTFFHERVCKILSHAAGKVCCISRKTSHTSPGQRSIPRVYTIFLSIACLYPLSHKRNLSTTNALIVQQNTTCLTGSDSGENKTFHRGRCGFQRAITRTAHHATRIEWT